MPGFKAGFAWYWGSPCPDRGRAATKLVAHHVILGGAPSDVLDCISKFIEGGDIYTYKTPGFFSPSNLVIVLKNKCTPRAIVRRQCNDIDYDLRD